MAKRKAPPSSTTPRKQSRAQPLRPGWGEVAHSGAYKYGGRQPNNRPTAKRARTKPGSAVGRSR